MLKRMKAAEFGVPQPISGFCMTLNSHLSRQATLDGMHAVTSVAYDATQPDRDTPVSADSLVAIFPQDHSEYSIKHTTW